MTELYFKNVYSNAHLQSITQSKIKNIDNILQYEFETIYKNVKCNPNLYNGRYTSSKNKKDNYINFLIDKILILQNDNFKIKYKHDTLQREYGFKNTLLNDDNFIHCLYQVYNVLWLINEFDEDEPEAIKKIQDFKTVNNIPYSLEEALRNYFKKINIDIE